MPKADHQADFATSDIQITFFHTTYSERNVQYFTGQEKDPKDPKANQNPKAEWDLVNPIGNAKEF